MVASLIQHIGIISRTDIDLLPLMLLRLQEDAGLTVNIDGDRAKLDRLETLYEYSDLRVAEQTDKAGGFIIE